MFVIGHIVSVYGALNDFEPVTLICALLIAFGLMLRVLIRANKSSFI